MREHPQRWSWKWKLIVGLIRLVYCSLILAILGFIYEISGCSHRPVMGRDNLKYGNFYPFRYQGAPFCCVYVGLDFNEKDSFWAFFANFAQTNSIHQVTKHYMSYSGEPLANYMGDHIAVFVDSVATTQITEAQGKMDPALKKQFMEQTLETGEFDFVFWWYCFWPTNTSRIRNGDSNMLASYTGSIKMVSFDRQYSPKEFTALAVSLTNALQKLWPNHTVEAFIYEGK